MKIAILGPWPSPWIWITLIMSDHWPSTDFEYFWRALILLQQDPELRRWRRGLDALLGGSGNCGSHRNRNGAPSSGHAQVRMPTEMRQSSQPNGLAGKRLVAGSTWSVISIRKWNGCWCICALSHSFFGQIFQIVFFSSSLVECVFLYSTVYLHSEIRIILLFAYCHKKSFR